MLLVSVESAVTGLVVTGLVVTGLVVTGLVVTGLVVTGLVVTGLVVTGVVVADPRDGDVVGSMMEGSPPHARITMHAVTGTRIFLRIRDAFTMFGNLT